MIEATLRSFPGILSATYSIVTKTVVLYHNYDVLPKKYLCQMNHFFKKSVPSDIKDEDEHVKGQIQDLGIVLGAYVVEKAFFSMLPYNFFRPTSLAILFASRDFIKKGLKTITKPDHDTLTTASLIASIAKGSPKSAFVIYLMSTIGEILTEHTANRTRRFVREMMELDTSEAWLINEDGEEVKVSTDFVKKNDKIIIFQGEKIPFDGIVTAYDGHVDQSAITGEYMPASVSEGSYVYAGSIVIDGKIIVEVDKIGEDLAVNRMIKLIEEAQDKQAPIQMTSEKFTKKVVPISFGVAGMIYLLTKDWNRVLNMLVIDFVCGTKLSTATAISASIGRAAREGVLVKGGQTLETLSKINTVVFDKTGTITEGRPVVQRIITCNGYSENEILAYAASAEEHSSHPIAEAICKEAEVRNLDIPEHDNQTIENMVGRGISVFVNDEQVIVGNRKLMEDCNVPIAIDKQSGVFVAKEKELIGIIDIEDQVRYGMDRTINQLRDKGVDKVIMLTGDNLQSAMETADQIEVDEVIAEAMPQEKVDFVKSLKKEKDQIVMMVGDGINDAPALANADVGVSLGGKKTDIAMETSDVVINSDNPLLLPEIVKISQQAMRTIRNNILVTILVNGTVIVLGSFGIFQPTVGAAIHNAATIGVVLNSARLILIGRGRRNVWELHNQPLDTWKNKIDLASIKKHKGVHTHRRNLCINSRYS